MTRRGALALALCLAACAGTPTVVETIEAGPLPLPLLPGLVVPDVVLPPTQPDREAASRLARDALAAALGARPVAAPAPLPVVVEDALSRGLPRVVELVVVRAETLRSGLFAPRTAIAAMRVRVVDARTGWLLGEATLLRRSRSEGLAEAVAALAAGLLA